MLALSLSDKFCCLGIFVFVLVFVNENHTVDVYAINHTNSMKVRSLKPLAYLNEITGMRLCRIMLMLLINCHIRHC